MTRKTGSAIQKAADILEFPKEVIMDTPRVTIVGNIKLSIENHRGIIEYERYRIRVNTNTGVFKITGSNLIIESILPEEIIITGEIENIDISS